MLITEAGGEMGRAGTRSGPVIVLSYPHSGAYRVQELLAAGTSLACTSGSGILPQCAAIAEAWRRLEGHDGSVMSRLALSTIHGLVTAQVTAILASAGKSRWCDLSVADPCAAEQFHQVFPQAAFVCVHRGCLEVIRAGVTASPWGLRGLGPYLLAYPGNSVAALAASWADSTEELLAFTAANPQLTRQVRYEDVAAEPDEALSGLRVWLELGVPREARSPGGPESGDQPAQLAGPEVPAEMIPPSLRQRINRLHTRLGYPQVDQLKDGGTYP